MPQRRLGHLIPQVEHDRFEEVAPPAGDQLLVVQVTLPHSPEHDQHQPRRHQHHDDVVADDRDAADVVPVVHDVAQRVLGGQRRKQQQ